MCTFHIANALLTNIMVYNFKGHRVIVVIISKFEAPMQLSYLALFVFQQTSYLFIKMLVYGFRVLLSTFALMEEMFLVVVL